MHEDTEADDLKEGPRWVHKADPLPTIHFTTKVVMLGLNGDGALRWHVPHEDLHTWVRTRPAALAHAGRKDLADHSRLDIVPVARRSLRRPYRRACRPYAATQDCLSVCSLRRSLRCCT